MNRTTVERLNRLNLEFYSLRSAEFSRTRGAPWGGWGRVVEAALAGRSGERLSVVDVGCGNGRFATYLHERAPAFDYVGVDSSAELLEIASRSLELLPGVDHELLDLDLTHELPSARLCDRAFDLIVAFGLLHHIPGSTTRRDLLSDLRRLLSPTGVIALGFWQFADHERFRRRLIHWADYNRRTDHPVDLDQLEPGDHLLAWGDDPPALRYCHHADPAEVASLQEAAGLSPSETYTADGAPGTLNLYTLFRA